MSFSRRLSLPVLLLVALAILEPVSALLGGGWTKLAAWSWVALAAISLVATWLVIGTRLFQACRARHLFLLTVFVFGGVISFLRIGSYEKIIVNQEAVQQVVAGLKNWHKPTLGYHEGAFLEGSYPSRQYLLVAAPSVLVGPGLSPLRFGYAFLFFTGWSLFLVASRGRWAGDEARAPWSGAPLPVLAALLLLTFPPVIHWLMNYEQTILPLSFTLLATGWFCLWKEHSQSVQLLPLAWAAGMLGTCYTPGLTVWALFIGLIALGWVLRLNPRIRLDLPGLWSLSGVAFYALSMGATALWAMRFTLPLKFSTRIILTEKPMTAGELFNRVIDGFQALLYHPALPFTHPLFALLFVVPLIVQVTRKPTRATVVPSIVWLWMMGTVVASVTLRGYCHRPPSFDLHRAMVVLPLLLLLTMDFWASMPGPALKQWSAPLRVFAVAIICVITQLFLAVRDPISYEHYAVDMEAEFAMRIKDYSETLPEGTHSTFVLWVAPEVPTGDRLIELADYFTPNVKIRRENPDFATLNRAEKPFLALLTDDVRHRQILEEAGLLPHILPGRPLLAPLAKQYLLVDAAHKTGTSL